MSDPTPSLREVLGQARSAMICAVLHDVSDCQDAIDSIDAALAAPAQAGEPALGSLAQRCAVALQCLPDAPYRALLARLLADLQAEKFCDSNCTRLDPAPGCDKQ